MYKPTTKGAWQGRIDALDGEAGKRWHQAIQFLDLSKEIPTVQEQQVAFAFLGFCCDEGVRRNQGRTGAAAGPAALRKAMASFAYHLPPNVLLVDAGDVICSNEKLEEAQMQLGRKVALLLAHGYKPLVLGGGHEIAYGHYLGLQQAVADKDLGILNFDAHFDLRSYQHEPSSGTPFLQIADKMQQAGQAFKYNCLGIQEYGNTQVLFNTAENLGVKYTLANEVNANNLPALQQNLEAFLTTLDAVYITIDLDVFAAGYAPGVSAVNALGISPDVVVALLKTIMASGKLLSLDMAELNPSFDLDNRTAKLGAAILYQVVKEWSKV